MYTFEYYEHMFELLSYSLDLGIAKIPVPPALDGQPLQSKVRLPDGRYVWVSFIVGLAVSQEGGSLFLTIFLCSIVISIMARGSAARQSFYGE